jgi:menaquinone-9 beta-reductase
MEPLMSEPGEPLPLPLDWADPGPWDGIVIGAGPAGAMAARQLALAGRRVLLVEKKRFPRWKICGACLNGQALAVLRSVGLGSLVTRQEAISLDQFHVSFRGRSTRLAMPGGFALSRSRLDAALVDAAINCGVRFVDDTIGAVGESRDGLRLVRLSCQGRSTNVAARVVLMATGLGNSRLPDGSVARTQVRAGSRIGAGCLISDAPAFYNAGTVFMAVGREGYVGLVRVEDGSLNVAAAFAPAFVRRSGEPGSAAAAILAEAGLPLITNLHGAHWQGTAGLTRRTKPLALERLFLLGDAASYVEPYTGEGIAWALTSGHAVAPLALQAIERWEPQLARAWSKVHRRLIGRRQILCRATALTLRQPWLAPLAFGVLSCVPGSAAFLINRLNAPPSFTNASEPCPS